MNTNINKLKGKIRECGMTQEEFAKAIGMEKSTYYRKMQSGGIKFTIGQMHNAVKVLNLSSEEANDIFLPINLH